MRATAAMAAALTGAVTIAHAQAAPWPRDGVSRVIAAAVAQTRRPVRYDGVGRGPEIEDVLFAYPVTGHYR